ncbi:MAG: serine hydrolase, partial [Lachnospiraceae bacterium]|nr:serine hydrolase [Lachnospiraceae bacterium]
SGSSLEGTVFAGSDQVAAPVVQAEGAVLLNCGTGQILFGKNADQQFYPASITKVMTALLTIENCSLSDIVTFSEAATTNLESGAVTINLTAGDQLTVEQSLHALLLKSANEVANGLAEHISGSVSAFADKMNQRAAQLGCKNTHFANPNGLNNSTHKTTPYDMALIARAAYANPDISRISTTLTYQMPATKNGAAKTITMGHKMNYSTDSRYYPGMVGGKTGYTSKAGNTLVTCVERDGVRLAAVVMKASGTHYTDTKAMLDYGFALAAAGELERGAGSQSEPGSQGTAGGSTQETGVNPSEPAAPAQTGWVQEGNVWSYRKADGSKAAGEWLTINGEAYYFHSSGQMAANTWVRDGEKWLYAGSSGKMLKNTVTPDGYQVGTDGVWIP